MTYLDDAKSALGYSATEAKRDNHKTFAIAALADEQRTANLIAIMNSARIGSVKQNEIRDIVLARLDVPNTQLTVFDEEED